MKHHDQVEKLNIQAHHSALSKHDEFVVDSFNTLEKVDVLVHDLLAIEMWKDKVR